MKNLRILSMLLIATIAGLAAVVFASRWLSQQSSSGITKVVVAAADIDLGQRLSPDFIKTVDWPTTSLPPGAISDTHALDGRVVRTSLIRGEPVLESKLTPQGTAGGLSAVIADGKRAITVRVNDVVGVAGFALPGSYVDIIVNTIQDSKDAKAAGGDRADQSISKIVLEKILVLAVAQEVNRDDTKPKVVNAVTLEVTPDQAEKLDLARSVGTLSLVLRNQVDPHPADTAGATKRTLLKEPAITATVAVPVVKAVQAVRHVVERRVAGDCIGVIAGVQHSQECF
ncbi:Flp pilus assembly protein CpaB [Ralstonia pseudosolanacearum]|uniref:Flp pilus assembly protein CpaB n=1 Tax=Ralstonia pseudosolanacearum TaxID=1310165 RepID=UPI0020058E05|nr:Flp pilus assembly protein CpaB [Ralstonia pseudosolanacearum]MCK4127358.1 Flp pilus assembly protein CpaB [Ralstonia pseudosolanacearum]